MPVYIEYFDPIGTTPVWTVHDDGDTTIDFVVDISASPGFTTPTAYTQIAPGRFEITLSPAGVNVTETITTAVDTSTEPWLQYDWDNGDVFDDNPFALATFGIYEGNELQIYQRQLFQE